MPGRWLAFDVGCLECGEPSAVVGTFGSERQAREAAATAKAIQLQDWHGEHEFLVFDLEGTGNG